MTPEELRALGTATDVSTAGRAFGMSRATAYRAAKAGELPCPVLRVGNRYVVPVEPLLAVLGIER